MDTQNILNLLRFYFITDDRAPVFSPFEQVRAAVRGGATLIQYRNKAWEESFLPEVVEIRQFCQSRKVPFIINDHISLARQVMADGVHVGQEDASPARAREMLGEDAIIGVSVSNREELARTDLSPCDYMGVGPVFPTGTKADAKAVKGLEGLKAIIELSPIPVVAIGGLTAENAAGCFASGAAGAAVISFISRADAPLERARAFAASCGLE